MSLVSGIVVYILLWWWVFFMTLPFGVKRVDQVEDGHDAAAPVKSHTFGRKYWRQQGLLLFSGLPSMH